MVQKLNWILINEIENEITKFLLVAMFTVNLYVIL